MGLAEMPLGLRLAGLAVLLLLNSFVPGFVVVRRLRWRPLETLCAAVAASLILLYLFTFALYLSRAPMAWCAAGSAVAAVLACVVRRDLGRLFATRAVRRAALSLLGLFVWTLLFVALVRHFSGGAWGGDWLEHFQRCLFFLSRLPLDTAMHPDYHVTARPPFMNLLGAYFLAQAGDDFACFQVTFAFLNLLPLLSCALIARRLHRGGALWFPILPILFALCPLLIENATYTWTKLLSAFFVIFGVDLYLAALSRRAGWRTAGCGLALAAATLVHYSAIPFAAFIAGHHLVTGRLRRVAPAIPGLLLLATWLGWACATYGMSTTLTSNTSVGETRKLSAAANVAKSALNVVDTLVPHPLRGTALEGFRQESALGYLRDYVFLICQTNLILSIGSVAGVLAIALALRARRFWRSFVPFVVLAAVATHGSRDVFGLAHVVLQPLVLLGLTLVAAAWRRSSRGLRVAVLLGAVLDFGLGVALQHHVESLENTPERVVFNADAALLTDGTRLRLEWKTQGFLSAAAWNNWHAKQVRPLLQRQLERLEALPGEDARRAVGLLRQERQRLIDADARDWGGWFSRHDGRVTYLGDRLAGAAGMIRFAILAGFGAIVWTLMRDVSCPP